MLPSPPPPPPDADTFADEEQLLTRIPDFQFNFVTGKPHSKAFKNPRGSRRMSVDRARLSSVEQTLKGHPHYWGVYAITDGACRTQGQEVEYTPQDENLAHCDVVGDKPGSVSKALRDAARPVKKPSRSD